MDYEMNYDSEDEKKPDVSQLSWSRRKYQGNTMIPDFSFLEGDGELSDLRDFINDQVKQFYQERGNNTSISLGCARTLWPASSGATISSRNGRPTPFLLPWTNEKMLAARYVSGCLQIIVVQQEFGSTQLPFNGGQSTIVVPINQHNGIKRRWALWTPEKHWKPEDTLFVERVKGVYQSTYLPISTTNSSTSSSHAGPSHNRRSSIDNGLGDNKPSAKRPRLSMPSPYASTSNPFSGNVFTTNQASGLSTPKDSTTNNNSTATITTDLHDTPSPSEPTNQTIHTNTTTSPSTIMAFPFPPKPKPRAQTTAPSNPSTANPLPNSSTSSSTTTYNFRKTTTSPITRTIPSTKITNINRLFGNALCAGIITPTDHELQIQIGDDTIYISRDHEEDFRTLLTKIETSTIIGERVVLVMPIDWEV